MERECDIILLSYENPDLLERCVRSVLHHTKVHSRLIIVDNASNDPEVARVINSVKGNDTVSVEKIFSDENSGFAGGVNKGMKISDAQYVCLLNNDCLVTDGWLEEMIRVAETSSRIGLVNPQSNTFGSVPGKDVSIDTHAVRVGEKSGSFVELGYAIGFACLIKREVIDRIGYLDEIYRGVCYEDTDYSARAREAGFMSVIAEGSYVFHHEQASRKDLPGKEKIYAANKKIFEDRWGKLLRIMVLDPGSSELSDSASLYEIFKNMARQGVLVEVWTSDGYGLSDIPRKIKEGIIVRHADVNLRVFFGKIRTSSFIWRVLTKKKKYDAVIIPRKRLPVLRRALSVVSRSEILALESGLKVSTSAGEILDMADPAGIAEVLRRESR